MASAGRRSLDLLTSAVAPVTAPLRPGPRLPRRGRGGGGGELSGTARGAAAPAATAVAAPAVADAGEGDQELAVQLDWRPALTIAQEVIVWHTAAAVCCVAYALSAPAAVSVPYATCMGLLFGGVLMFMRASMMEVLYKAKEKFETDLGGPDSRFHTHDDLQVHVKVKAPPPGATPSAALHCYHGFGSNTWSWSLVQQELADKLGALVTAHDMPGFGLTERPSDLSGYYLAFNGRLGRMVMDHELREAGAMSASEAARAGDGSYPAASMQAGPAGGVLEAPVASAKDAAAESKAAGLEAGAAGDALAAAAAGDVASAAAAVKEAATGGASAPAAAAPAALEGTAAEAARSGAAAGAPPARRVLMGHSLGGACAALEAISRPQDYAALVLVDPAILVGFGAGGGKAMWLEQLHDDTALTRAHGGGGAGGDTGADAEGAPSSSASSDGEADGELRAAAADAGGLAPQSSLSGRSTPASGASGAAARAAPNGGSGGYTARVAGEAVAYYQACGTAELPAAKASPGPLGRLVNGVVAAMQTTMISAVVALILLLRPLVLWGLRAAVRSREFWKGTLQQAYYDKSKVSPACVDAYRLPQLVRGWESGMVRFLLARLGAKALGGGPGAYGADAGTGRAPDGVGLEDAGLAARLAAAAAGANLPVLLIHGAGDKLVPVSNTLRLARMMPGARVAVLKRAGHCPQEELPDAFVRVVASFLEGALAAPRATAKTA